MLLQSISLLCFTTLSLAANKYVIQLAPGLSVESFIKQHERTSYPVLEKIEAFYEFGNFLGVYGEFTQELLKAAVSDKSVISISQDRVLTIQDVQKDAPRHLAKLSSDSKLPPGQAPLLYEYDGTSGNGVDVYVLDTGIKLSHPELAPRTRFGSDFTGEGEGDENGHGTHVAGLIGSSTFGVSKKANLIEVKVAGKNGKSSISKILGGLQYVSDSQKITGKPSTAIIALDMRINTILNNAVEALVETGIPIITSAGNKGVASCKRSPASAYEALTVGAIDDDDDTIAHFSNYGSCVDVFTSGVNVTSLSLNDNQHVAYSGTSMSAAIVAGQVAYYMGNGDDGHTAVARVKANTIANIRK